MEVTWQKALVQLQEYIAKNPGIAIGAHVITIPGEVRPEFYRLLDGLRTGFIKDYFADSLEKASPLSTAWSEVSQSVKEQLSLESIEVAPDTGLFLRDPLEGLMRPLFDPLFELLKGITDTVTFENNGKRLISAAFASSFKEGYLRWVALALVSLLNPDKNYRVPVVDQVADPLMGEGHENPGQRVGKVPEAEESNKLSFQHHSVVSFVVPGVLVRSARLGRYIALRSEFVEPQWTARQFSNNAEWYDFTSIKRGNGLAIVRPDQKMLPDLAKILPDIAVYTAEDLEDITLLADHGRIMRPDICIEVMEENDWYEKGKMAAVKRHQDVMKPKFGTYVFCREAPPQAALDKLRPKPLAAPAVETGQQAAEVLLPTRQDLSSMQPAPEPPPNIHLITAGYDIDRLGILIEILSGEKQPAG